MFTFDQTRKAPQTTQQAFNLKLKELYNITSSYLDSVSSGSNGKYQESEKIQWSYLIEQAKGLINNPNSPVENYPIIAQEAWRSISNSGSFIDALSTRRNEITSASLTLAQKVVSKYDALQLKVASIKGNRTRLENQLNSLVANTQSTVNQILSFDLHNGWDI